ncbi:MAG: SDR family NAD(P)-dependent oxidoreductase [Alphaproteobacteria bacterium]|nr:SDR family NAD(P)-dependent oxidoreductase [Alphaproteobacteria bacterium]
MSRAPDTWLIVGASSAIARAFARRAAAANANIVLAGRDRADLEATAADLRVRFTQRVEVVDFDAGHPETHAAALERARSFAAPAVLNLFVAVGVMPSQVEIDADPELAERVVETNFGAVVRFLQSAAPVFEAQKRGRIVVLGSVAGDRGRLSNYVYGAAKAGLHAYLQGLRARLWRAGVTVTTVKPGPVDTAMTFGLDRLPLLVQPDAVAAICFSAALAGREEIYAPSLWRLIMAIVCAIPEKFFKKLSI